MCIVQPIQKPKWNGKSRPSAQAKFLHEKTDHAQETQIRIKTELCTCILSVLHEAEFEAGGAMRGRRTHNFSLNPSKSCMKCQRWGGALLHVMKCFMLLLNQEKRHFQGIDNSPLTQRLWSQNNFCQWNVGTLWRWVKIHQTYFSLQVRMTDLTSSFLYLTYTPFPCTILEFSRNINWKFNLCERGT